MGQNVSGTSQRTIQDLQAQIQQLRKEGVAQNKDKILELNRQISEALTGKSVNAGMTDIGITQNSAGDLTTTGETDTHIAGNEMISRVSQYEDKDKVRNEFCTPPQMSDAEYKALGEELDRLGDERKQCEKKTKDKNASLAEINTAKARIKEIDARIKEITGSGYEVEKVRRRAYEKNKGVGGIQKAAKHDKKNMTNVLELENVFPSGEAGDRQMAEYMEAHPGAKVKQLSKTDHNILKNLYLNAQSEFEEAQQLLAEGQISQAQFEQIDRETSHFRKVFNTDENGNVDENSINFREVQDALVDYSGYDENFNLDESDQLAGEVGRKRKNINSLVKKFGFGVENTFGRKLGAAAIAAGTAGLGNLISGALNSKHAHSEQRVSIPEQTHVVFDGVNKEKLEYLNEFGQKVIDRNVEVLTHTTTTGGFDVSAVADAAVNLLSGTGLAGQFLGPLAAGLTTFFLYNPKTEDAFNGMTVDAALASKNLDNIKGDDNKLIMANIIDMDITGNPELDLRIKSSIIQAGIGKETTNANTEELLACYEAIKMFKEQLGKIEVPEQPTVPTVPTIETHPTVPTETPQPSVVAGVGWAKDYKLLDSRGASRTSNDPNARAQYVDANEVGELSFTGKPEAPDTITMRDNTNGKVNTYEYRKLTLDDIERGYVEVNGKRVPIKRSSLGSADLDKCYIRVSVTDSDGSLISNSSLLEVYQLQDPEPITSEDGKTVTYNYYLEQFDGMAGSGRSSMRYNQRARR